MLEKQTYYDPNAPSDEKNRFAGSVIKGNPVGAVISDLIFPRGLADGTREGGDGS